MEWSGPEPQCGTLTKRPALGLLCAVRVSGGPEGDGRHCPDIYRALCFVSVSVKRLLIVGKTVHPLSLQENELCWGKC